MEVQESSQEFNWETWGNARRNGDLPSLAREGNSEVDRRKREELEQPRKFQEDDELYEEKALGQKRFARGMAAAIQKNFARATYCPAGCPDDTTTTTGCPDGATMTATPTEQCHAQCAAFSPFVLSGSPRSMRSPPGLTAETSIGGVENEIKILSGKSWRQDQAKRDQVMIQNLEKNPTTICVDSGAGESVCPVDFFPDYEMHQTERSETFTELREGRSSGPWARKGLSSK